MNSEKQNLRPVFADQVNTMVNLLKPYIPSTETYENSDGGTVHPTRNSDGSISVSGETLDAGITIKAGTAYLRTGKSYCLCGTPGQGINLQIIIDGKTYTDRGTGIIFSVGSSGYFDVNVVIDPHTQIDKLTIYPIVTSNIQAKFGDFVPYISDTDQLNAQVAELSEKMIYKDISSDVTIVNYGNIPGTPSINYGIAVLKKALRRGENVRVFFTVEPKKDYTYTEGSYLFAGMITGLKIKMGSTSVAYKGSSCICGTIDENGEITLVVTASALNVNTNEIGFYFDLIVE